MTYELLYYVFLKSRSTVPVLSLLGSHFILKGFRKEKYNQIFIIRISMILSNSDD